MRILANELIITMVDELLLFVVGLLLGAWAIKFFLQQKKTRSLKKISERAKIGESEAVKLLQKEGYRILEEQSRMPVEMYIGKERYESYIKADFIVEKNHKRYLAEVKTGKQANPRLPNVRRQLFEYQNLFETDGILFIDMNKYDIIEVSFSVPKTMNVEYKYFFTGVFVGICLMVFIFSYF